MTNQERKQEMLDRLLSLIRTVLGPSYLSTDDEGIKKEVKATVELMSGGEFTMTSEELNQFIKDI